MNISIMKRTLQYVNPHCDLKITSKRNVFIAFADGLTLKELTETIFVLNYYSLYDVTYDEFGLRFALGGSAAEVKIWGKHRVSFKSGKVEVQE